MFAVIYYLKAQQRSESGMFPAVKVVPEATQFKKQKVRRAETV